MSTNAIIMMAIALIIIWGGLLVSLIKNPIKSLMGFFYGKSAVGFCGVLKHMKKPPHFDVQQDLTMTSVR